MTKTPTRTTRRSVRSLGGWTQAQASAWWAVHGSEVPGTRGEFDGQSVIGTLDHPVIGDGWGWPLNLEPSTTERPASTRQLKGGGTATRTGGGTKDHPRHTTLPAACEGFSLTEEHLTIRQPHQVPVANLHGQTPRMARYEKPVTGSLKEPINYAEFDYPVTSVRAARLSRPYTPITLQRGSLRLTSIFDGFAQVARRSEGLTIVNTEAVDPAARLAGQRARRVALSQVAKFGRLSQDAPLLGQPVPRSLWFDSKRGNYAAQHRSRTISIATAFPVQGDGGLTSEELVADNSQVEVIAFQDLCELLRSHGTTAKELEALERSAAGVAQPDRNARYALARGREKAQRIVAGKIITKFPRTTRVFCWVTVDATFTTA